MQLVMASLLPLVAMAIPVAFEVSSSSTGKEFVALAPNMEGWDSRTDEVPLGVGCMGILQA